MIFGRKIDRKSATHCIDDEVVDVGLNEFVDSYCRGCYTCSASQRFVFYTAFIGAHGYVAVTNNTDEIDICSVGFQSLSVTE